MRFLEGLLKDDLKVVMLHGKRTQEERNQAIQDFKAGKCQVLIATDVASRGLHIRNLPYIVNYDFPSRLETYIHRVGRTGRLAAYGHAYSFFTRNLVYFFILFRMYSCRKYKHLLLCVLISVHPVYLSNNLYYTWRGIDHPSHINFQQYHH